MQLNKYTAYKDYSFSCKGYLINFKRLNCNYFDVRGTLYVTWGFKKPIYRIYLALRHKASIRIYISTSMVIWGISI